MNGNILRKEISREIIGHTETVKFEYHKQHIITKEEYNELYDNYAVDDYECAYGVGLSIDFNDDIVCIEIDNLIDGLKEFIANVDEDDKGCYRYKIFVKLHAKLQKWKGYTLWI